MNKILYITLLYISALTIPANTISASEADSIRLSLLTCSPGEEIYSLFGHTAIRYENYTRGEDIVFNYGLFSFNTPNFNYRFALGKTDYQLGITDYQHFAAEYASSDRSIWQQTLNLDNEEKDKLANLLFENYRPENRVYRYNYFYDNCATRPRDKIEESIIGKVIYPPLTANNEQKTYRDIVHQYTKGHPWAQFGIDFCIGSEADHPITARQTMFSPFYLKDYFATAQINSNGKSKPLISDTQQIVIAEPTVPEREFILTPLQSALFLFILIAAATIYGIKKKKSLWGIDLILFATAGIAGCVIAFLVLFSQHPAVSSNYLLLVFHPGHLIFLPFFICKERKGQKSWYHILNCIVLTLFIVLFPIIPQKIDLAVLPLALCLLIRSASNLILTYNKHR